MPADSIQSHLCGFSTSPSPTPKAWESHEFFLPDSITASVLFEGTFIQSMRQGSEWDELHHLMT